MKIDKIHKYLFFQISRYFLLILFIFLSVAWLLQVTRLFTITNLIHIEVIDVILLSFYLIPNLITIIIPFILIFGLLLCFIKLNRDNELISILSLGFGLKPLKRCLYIFSFLILLLFILLNFFLAPSVYELYKSKEYNLRNTLDLNKMSFSNFLNLNTNTILDFKKKGNDYEDIFISFEDDKDNLIYAKKGNIFIKNNKFNFQLSNGFKISINKEKEIEKLEFLNYILKIENKNINSSNTIDKNTFTIFDDINSKNYLNICFRFTDIIIIIYIIFLFYKNNLRNINFNTYNNVYFSLSCIILLIINQILKNSEIILFTYTIFIFSIILFSLIITFLKNKYE